MSVSIIVYVPLGLLITKVLMYVYSEVFKSERNYTALLGGTQFNSTGHLIGAKATYMAWFTESSDLTTEKDTDRQLGLDDYVGNS